LIVPANKIFICVIFVFVSSNLFSVKINYFDIWRGNIYLSIIENTIFIFDLFLIFEYNNFFYFEEDIFILISEEIILVFDLWINQIYFDLLKGLWRKNERGYRMKPENLRHWTIHIRYLSDVSASRNLYKTVSKLYENSYIYNFV